jgi:5'-AMP-activated protein kinase regulatory gamma subunit
MGAYHDLDLTIAQALARRSADFAGVVTCTPDDSLASVFHLIRMRRIHRLVIVEGGKPVPGETQEEAALREQRKGKLLGMISLSDVLQHIIVRSSPLRFVSESHYVRVTGQCKYWRRWRWRRARRSSTRRRSTG